MTGLLNVSGQSNELAFIRTSVEDRLSTLKQRVSRLASGTITSGLCGAGLVVAGLLLLALGAMPEDVELVNASFEANTVVSGDMPPGFQTTLQWLGGSLGKVMSVMILVVGISLGVARQAFIPMVSSIAAAIMISQAPHIIETFAAGAISPSNNVGAEAIPAVSRAHVDDLIEGDQWSELSLQLSKMPSPNNKVSMLHAQALFKAGQAQQAWALIEANDLGISFAEQVWRIETLMHGAGTITGPLSPASRDYEKSMRERQVFGSTLIRTSIPFLAIFSLLLVLTLVVRKNYNLLLTWTGENPSTTKPVANERS